MLPFAYRSILAYLIFLNTSNALKCYERGYLDDEPGEAWKCDGTSSMKCSRVEITFDGETRIVQSCVVFDLDCSKEAARTEFLQDYAKYFPEKKDTLEAMRKNAIFKARCCETELCNGDPI